MKIGNRNFDTDNNMYIMGILNVTKDSFSDGGKFVTLDSQLYHVDEMIKEGADIIDIGGESTRPGFIPVSAEEEIDLVVPIIEKVKSEFDICLSLDTTKAAVAAAGISAGIDMINDIWGLKKDDKMAGVISEANLPVVIMHNRKEALYQDFLKDVMTDLDNSLQIAHENGITDDNIILDPGVGFAKSTAECLEIIKLMPKLIDKYEYPWLMAASRKSVIGNTLNLPVDQRLEGTLAITAHSFMTGCSFVRVHDVLPNKRLIDMLSAIERA